MSILSEKYNSEETNDSIWLEKEKYRREYNQVVQTLFAFQDINKIDHTEVMLEVNRLLEADWQYRELQD